MPLSTVCRIHSRSDGRTAQLHQRAARQSQLLFITLSARQEIVFAPTQLDGAADGVRMQNHAGTHAVRHSHFSTTLVEINFSIPDDVIDGGDRLAARTQP